MGAVAPRGAVPARLYLVICSLGVAIPAIALAAAPAVDGEALYRNKCSGCHSIETDRIGPRHRDVVGRQVASVPGYDYSPALKQLGGTWTPERLDTWLSGTQKMAPGSKMYLALDDVSQRRLIIEYLQSVSGQGSAR